MHPVGQYVRAVIASDDLTSATAFSFLNENDQVVPLTTDDRLVIHHLTISNGSNASSFSIFQDLDNDDVNDSGELRYKAILAASGFAAVNFFGGLRMAQRPTPTAGDLMVQASAASVGTTIVIIGTILRT